MKRVIQATVAALAALTLMASAALAVIDFSELTAVQDGGADIVVYGNAVPAACDWNEDGRQDLIVGEGGLFDGKVRVYLNVGSSEAPDFDGFFYAQTASGDLAHGPSG